MRLTGSYSAFFATSSSNRAGSGLMKPSGREPTSDVLPNEICTIANGPPSSMMGTKGDNVLRPVACSSRGLHL